MNLEWSVFYYDFSAKEIKVSNVFRHGRYKEEVEELLHKCKDIEEFWTSCAVRRYIIFGLNVNGRL